MHTCMQCLPPVFLIFLFISALLLGTAPQLWGRPFCLRHIKLRTSLRVLDFHCTICLPVSVLKFYCKTWSCYCTCIRIKAQASPRQRPELISVNL